MNQKILVVLAAVLMSLGASSCSNSTDDEFDCGAQISSDRVTLRSYENPKDVTNSEFYSASYSFKKIEVWHYEGDYIKMVKAHENFSETKYYAIGMYEFSENNDWQSETTADGETRSYVTLKKLDYFISISIKEKEHRTIIKSNNFLSKFGDYHKSVSISVETGEYTIINRYYADNPKFIKDYCSSEIQVGEDSLRRFGKIDA